jgi:hypothetical protein
LGKKGCFSIKKQLPLLRNQKLKKKTLIYKNIHGNGFIAIEHYERRKWEG